MIRTIRSAFKSAVAQQQSLGTAVLWAAQDLRHLALEAAEESLNGVNPMLKLVLLSDLSDIWRAAIDARPMAEYISTREGWPVSCRAAFHSLLQHQPWKTSNVLHAPWRVVRNGICRLGY